MEGLGTNGQWGGICRHGFDIQDANVICRMLGFAYAMVAYDSKAAAILYGTAPSGNKFVLDDLECTGEEASVFHCIHNGEWIEDCGADDIAGVQCGKGKINQFLKSVELEQPSCYWSGKSIYYYC